MPACLCRNRPNAQLPFGGRDITSYIERHLLEQSDDLEIKSLADFNVIDQLKKECCYCGTSPVEHADSFEMPDGTEVEGGSCTFRDETEETSFFAALPFLLRNDHRLPRQARVIHIGSILGTS